mmetsp:Transcript_26548/g.43138  ORF Transcript_26548/g.43138 Transcript_26548/m.43138 type:complete len:655 (+) Transcript_26548:132-2096(+)
MKESAGRRIIISFVAVLFVSGHVVTSFTPTGQRTLLASTPCTLHLNHDGVSELDIDIDGSSSSTEATQNVPSELTSISDRRSMLLSTSAVALTSFAALSMSSASSAAETLEELSLGDAKWDNAADAVLQSPSIPLSARIVPPSFATYLARFLLHYDEGALRWWEKQADSFSLLASYEAKKRESKSFSSYTSSIQKGLYSYISGENESNIKSYSKVRTQYSYLLTSLVDKYGSKEGAIRDIGLLFAILPPVYQPTEEMMKLDKGVITNTGSNKGSKLDNFTPNFQEDFTLLLPNKYQMQYNGIEKSYTITPKINLFEIEISEEPGVKAISTTFGPLSSKPLLRERSLSLDIYALLGISGGAGCALTHTLVIPLDVVKTRMQTNPGEYNGVFDGAATITREEGIGALLLGTQATIVGYLWYGISVYPSYAFFKRFIASTLMSPAFAVAHANDVALVAGALASVIASLGLTPLEACRIRAVAQPEIYRDAGLIGTGKIIASENDQLGWKTLYAGLPSLMIRQVIFGSVKFLAFERASEAIFSIHPEFREATVTALGVSLVAGGISGALSSVVSQPADSVLTYVAKDSGGNLGVFDGARKMIREEGVKSLFNGLGSRCVWAGCIIAGQFLLYDVFRAAFGITGEDLNQALTLTLDLNN